MPFPLRAVRGNCWDRTASRDQSRLSRRTPLTVRPSVSGAPKHTETSRKPQGAYSKQPVRLLPVIALCARSPQARDKRSSARTRVSAAASPDSPGRHVASGYPLRRVRRVPHPLLSLLLLFLVFFLLFCQLGCGSSLSGAPPHYESGPRAQCICARNTKQVH